MRHLLVLTALCLISSTATSMTAELRHRDIVRGTLDAEGSEAGFTMELLAGSELTLKVQGTDQFDLEPEILLFDPDDFAIEPGPALKHKDGSSKSKLKALVIGSSGTHTIVIRRIGSSTGAFRLKVDVEHPRKIRSAGTIADTVEIDVVRFPAFSGSVATFKVKGRQGFLPVVRTMLQPDLSETQLTNVTTSGTSVRSDGIFCPDYGDYRLSVQSSGGIPSAGTWKSKVKLLHPTLNAREFVVDGEPEGTFTDDKKEPGGGPTLPATAIAQTTTFRVRISIPQPTEGVVYQSGDRIGVTFSLEAISNASQQVDFSRTPWQDLQVRRASDDQIVWRLNPIQQNFGPTETFPQGDVRFWSTVYDLKTNTGASIGTGRFRFVAVFSTNDPRIPTAEAALEFTVE